jgi:hypothetical protein
MKPTISSVSQVDRSHLHDEVEQAHDHEHDAQRYAGTAAARRWRVRCDGRRWRHIGGWRRGRELDRLRLRFLRRNCHRVRRSRLRLGGHIRLARRRGLVARNSLISRILLAGEDVRGAGELVGGNVSHSLVLGGVVCVVVRRFRVGRRLAGGLL